MIVFKDARRICLLHLMQITLFEELPRDSMSPTDKNNLFAFYLATVSKPFPSKSISHETKTFTYFQSPFSSIKLFLLFY